MLQNDVSRDYSFNMTLKMTNLPNLLVIITPLPVGRSFGHEINIFEISAIAASI